MTNYCTNAPLVDAGRRQWLGMAGAATTITVLAGSAPLAAAREATAKSGTSMRANPTPVSLEGPALLDAFMKTRAATDDRVMIGWMDAVTYAFIEGETFPLYRLFAATWMRFKRTSPDRYDGLSLEIANFHDIETGAPLKTLAMPKTGAVVEVPRYRAGPTKTDVVVRVRDEKPFGMQRETQQGESFFRAGIAKRQLYITQPERDGDTFMVREDIDTRVIPDDPKTPGFFYREWTIRRSPWDIVMDPKSRAAPSDVIYSSMAAFRPWMKMTGVNGHTAQNGFGGKVEKFDDLPQRMRNITREFHPDLVADPVRALGPL